MFDVNLIFFFVVLVEPDNLTDDRLFMSDHNNLEQSI